MQRDLRDEPSFGSYIWCTLTGLGTDSDCQELSNRFLVRVVPHAMATNMCESPRLTKISAQYRLNTLGALGVVISLVPGYCSV